MPGFLTALLLFAAVAVLASCFGRECSQCSGKEGVPTGHSGCGKPFNITPNVLTNSAAAKKALDPI